MRINRFINSAIYLLLLIIFCGDVTSQAYYILKPEESKMIIEGTSSLHDWQMKVTDMNCSTKFTTDGRKINNIQSIDFSCIPTSIVSDNKLMDKKTYEALKAELYYEIDFKMIKGEITSGTADGFTGTVTGNLFIAGQSREIKFPFRVKIHGSGQLLVEGKIDLKMSEFKIEPPTAMFGTLKTGDEISIVYSFEFDSPDNLKQVSEIKPGIGDSN